MAPIDMTATIKMEMDGILEGMGYQQYEIKIVDEENLSKEKYRRVTVSGKKNNEDCSEMFFVKTTHGLEDKVKSVLAKKYEREGYLYKEVFSKFENMQTDRPRNAKVKLPKCYSVTDSCIILQHFSELDFIEPLKDESLEFDHIALLISEIARFHAFSFAMRDKNSEEFEKLTKNLTDRLYESDQIQSIHDTSMNFALEFLDDSGIKEKLKNADLLNKIKSLGKVENISRQYSVICHGDCSMKNILVNYEDSEPCEMVFLDYNLAKLSSPASDVFFTLATTLSSESWSHYHNLLDLYYNTLTYTLKHLECNVRTCYPREIFDAEIIRFQPYAVGISLITKRLYACPDNEKITINNILDNPDTLQKAFHYDSKEGNEMYKAKINRIMHAFARHNFI